MADLDMRSWALKGAEQRLFEIGQEARAIFTMFPELRDQDREFMSRGTAAASRPRDGGRDSVERRKPRKRRRMSAEARKKIGDAQRARWAKQKAQQSNRATAKSSGTPARTRRSRKKK